MADWKTPPALNANINNGANTFMAVVKRNLKNLKAAMVNQSIGATKIDSPYLGGAAVSNVIDKLIVGPTHGAEGGWSDHPNDSGGPTMRGVILITFRGSFDQIFINTNVSEVANAARTFKSLGWMTGGKGSAGWELGKQVLFRVCGDADIASLFVFAFAVSGTNKYPAAIMSSEPFLGYLMHQGAWASGGGYFTMYKYNKAFSTIGYKGSSTAEVPTVTKRSVIFDGTNLTQDRAFPVALAALGSHATWILGQQGTKNGVFVKGWLNRLVFNPSISWTHNLAGFVQAFESGQIATNKTEQAFLTAKAKLYKQTILNFPNLT